MKSIVLPEHWSYLVYFEKKKKNFDSLFVEPLFCSLIIILHTNFKNESACHNAS